MGNKYYDAQPTHEQIEAGMGPAVLEFGVDWCGHCRAARNFILAALQEHAEITHLRIEDGKGRRLGRMFGVKLWPTLVFVHDGQEVSRLVRPDSVGAISAELRKIACGTPK